ncbi:transmembrane protein 182 [Amia ocellicauda]|uniref:transmembrane protein 182 n=1 Tax=Amia ocellicauda TaxID=2972642 RepID=UPI0034648A5E|nr:TM182 protein [Amia calva]
MKLSVALFFAGFFGALGTVFFLVSFGTDYWLLVSETCSPNETASKTVTERGDGVLSQKDTDTTFYHEGLFWRCTFGGKMGEDSMWKFWFTNQPPSKVCSHAYLFPFPTSAETNNSTAYSPVIYRGFWSIFMLIGVAAVVIGGFVIICAAPFASHKLYKAGGGLFLTSGLFFLAVIVMYVIWVHVLDGLTEYTIQKQSQCKDFTVNVRYGLSFMFAPVGVFFCLLAGLLFLLIGRTVQLHYN